MKRVIVLAVLLGGILAAPATAAEGLSVTTQQAVPIGGSTGTFSMSGDLTDAGPFHFTSFFITTGMGSPVTTEHVSELWVGSAGTLFVEKQCRTVFVGFGATDECQALVTGGTGAYAGLHGAGSCTGFIDFRTGIASQTCDFPELKS